ncbi:MAG: hypothetical protein BHW65_04390 [Verrucomicrobia bacterium CAG:312_58_20]|nr:MAG: hypothetical protein BHW65_04390 [Verrucomicrobia bacterium CAG:312_58_20]
MPDGGICISVFVGAKSRPHLPRGFSLCGAFAAGLKAVAVTQGNPIPTEARFQEAKGGMNIRPASLQKPRRGATNGAQKNKKTGK